MLTQRTFTSVAVLVPAIIFGGLTLVAQDRQTNQPVQPLPAQVQETRVVPRMTTSYAWEPNNLTRYNFQGWAGGSENEVSKAMKTFQEAESDDAKDEAKSELRFALADEYENRMNQYDEHIESLEKELESMRERLSRRRKAKDDMVRLKLQELLAKADGLGWPTGPTSGASSRLMYSRFQNTPPFGEASSPALPIPRSQVQGTMRKVNDTLRQTN